MPVHDLTRPIEPGMSGYPDDPPVECRPYATVEADGYRATELRLTTHAGTHVDAPAHTEPDGRTVDDYAPEALRFDAVRLDVAPGSARAPVTREAVLGAAAAATPAPAEGAEPPAALATADLVVLDVGWADRWGAPEYADHPYLTAAAATTLADAGCHVGLDALSVDPTPTERAGPDEPEGLAAHRALLGAGRLVVENLASPAALPDRFRLRAAPLPVADGDAAPARVTAEW